MNNLDILIKEKLIIPNYNKANIIDLIRTVYNNCGCHYEKNRNMLKLDKIITNKKHIVFILIDGMGSNILNKLPKNSLFKEHKVMNLNTIFPTSTACILTSLATGKYPSNTGIFGWFGYNRNLNLNYYTVLTKRREDDIQLDKELNDIFVNKSILNTLNRKTVVLQPKNINDSNYSKYFANDGIRFSYNDYDDAFKIVKKEINNSKDTFTYLYIPNVDKFEHLNGPYCQTVYNEILKIEESIKKILPLNDDTEIIITADHGQLPIKKIEFMNLNKYMKYFYALPSIDYGTSSFYVKKEMKKEFVQEFNKDFKNMLLFETNDFINNNIFGDDMTDYAKSCLGEYIGICKKNVFFYFDYNELEKFPLGNHTGMSKDEFLIPLIVL